jgi:hypothetical protein
MPTHTTSSGKQTTAMPANNKSDAKINLTIFSPFIFFMVQSYSRPSTPESISRRYDLTLPVGKTGQDLIGVKTTESSEFSDVRHSV